MIEILVPSPEIAINHPRKATLLKGTISVLSNYQDPSVQTDRHTDTDPVTLII